MEVVRPPSATDGHANSDPSARERTSVVSGLTDFQAWAARWDRLVDQVEAPVSMRSYAVSAWAGPRPDRVLRVVLVERDGTLVAGAAVTVRQTASGRVFVDKAGVPGEPLRLLHRDTAAGRLLASAVLDVCRDADRRWSLRLEDLPGDDEVAMRIRACAAARAVSHPVTPTPVLDVTSSRPLDQVLSRNVRSAVNRAGNVARREGRAVTMTWHEEPHDVESMLPELIDLHIRRNEQLRGTALLSDRVERDTWVDTIRGHAGAGVLRLLVARVDGRLAAFAAAVLDHRRLWVWSNYVAPEWRRLSAGTLANAEVVRAAHADPEIDVVDWGAGVQRYKMSGGAILQPAQTLRVWGRRRDAARWRLRERVEKGPLILRRLLDLVRSLGVQRLRC